MAFIVMASSSPLYYRQVSMPDRMTNTITASSSPTVYRPTAINCYASGLDTMAMWWTKWVDFMFTNGPNGRPMKYSGAITMSGTRPNLPQAELSSAACTACPHMLARMATSLQRRLNFTSYVGHRSLAPWSLMGVQ